MISLQFTMKTVLVAQRSYYTTKNIKKAIKICQFCLTFVNLFCCFNMLLRFTLNQMKLVLNRVKIVSIEHIN
jgi:hypothetical protein